MLYNVRGFAEEEGWPDMANGHVLSRAPKWVQTQFLKKKILIGITLIVEFFLGRGEGEGGRGQGHSINTTK
jgi:hypothetical protein